MSQAPTVPFAAVASAQELELLAEVSVGGGNASEIARRILRRLPAEPGRRSALPRGCEVFLFHYSPVEQRCLEQRCLELQPLF